MKMTKSEIEKVPQDKEPCRQNGFMKVEAKFGFESHTLCVRLKPIGTSSIAHSDAALFLNPEFAEESDNHNYIQAYQLNSFSMAYGFPLEDPASGSAEGYVGDDNQFYGLLHIGNRTLFADPYGKDDPNKFFGAFDHDNMTPPRLRRDHDQMDIDRRALPYHIETTGRVHGSARARICDLLLLADMEFFKKDANFSLNNVVRRMMYAVAQADIIFRNADFNEDGIPDNIGFSVKYIIVLTSEETNTRVFGDLLDTHAIDGREYLMRFARLRRLSEVCLGVAFSGHAFHNRTLGLSFTSLGGGLGGAAGGLCDRRAYGRSFNTLAIAHATTEVKERVPERIAAMTLAHEMGHSFGAHHDDNFPNLECRGYLMGSQSSVSEDAMYFEFSICSKRLIASTLSSMSYCFTEEDKPFCGNVCVHQKVNEYFSGIVEEGEACDCGLPSRCNYRDPCCTPRAGGALNFGEGTVHMEGCSVAPSVECHPSQGLCCLPNCKYADLSDKGIDCKNQDQDCECDADTLCPCGLGGICLRNGSCRAAECGLLGLEECQCIRSPGGAIERSRMCGICCKVERGNRSPQCVGAEQAANEFMMTKEISPLWPSAVEYNGPNVSVELCTRRSECRSVSLRAWERGSACVTRGEVGVCTARGICTTLYHAPRANIYPDIKPRKMRSKVVSVNKAASCHAKWKLTELILLVINMLHLFYEQYLTFFCNGSNIHNNLQ